MRTGFLELGFKLRFMLIFCLITLTAVSVASFLFYFLTYRELSSHYGEAFFTLQSVKKAVFPLLFASIQSVALLILVSIGIAVLSLFFSHKIAGPLYRFEKSLETIGSGDLTHVVRLRSGDQIQELVKTINDSVHSINYRIKGAHDVLSRFRTIEERFKTLLENDFQQKELREIAEDLQRELTELQKILAMVKMEG